MSPSGNRTHSIQEETGRSPQSKGTNPSSSVKKGSQSAAGSDDVPVSGNDTLGSLKAHQPEGAVPPAASATNVGISNLIESDDTALHNINPSSTHGMTQPAAAAFLYWNQKERRFFPGNHDESHDLNLDVAYSRTNASANLIDRDSSFGHTIKGAASPGTNGNLWPYQSSRDTNHTTHLLNTATFKAHNPSSSEARSSSDSIRYWTEEEHGKFMEALSKYGPSLSRKNYDCKAIANYVGTRTRKQVRSHLQKHLLKVRTARLHESRAMLGLSDFHVTHPHHGSSSMISTHEERNLQGSNSRHTLGSSSRHHLRTTSPDRASAHDRTRIPFGDYVDHKLAAFVVPNHGSGNAHSHPHHLSHGTGGEGDGLLGGHSMGHSSGSTPGPLGTGDVDIGHHGNFMYNQHRPSSPTSNFYPFISYDDDVVGVNRQMLGHGSTGQHHMNMLGTYEEHMQQYALGGHHADPLHSYSSVGEDQPAGSTATGLDAFDVHDTS